MKYLYLFLAIIFETSGSSLLNASRQFTRLWPSIFSILFFVGSLYFLSIALKSIPLGMAYSIWAGLGIVLTTIVGVLAFNQKIDIPAIIGISLIIAGVIVLNIFSKMQVH